MAQEGVTGLVFHARDVHHLETIPKGFFFKVSQPRVRDIFQGVISKELEEGLVVNGYDKVEHKVACLVQHVGHCQCLSFHRGIA